MSKEIALDLRRYDTSEKLGSLIFDTASLAIEASETDMPRVNPHFFVKKPEGRVIAPGRDKRDVLEMFVDGDPATEAAKEIRRLLLEDKGNFAYVWISPPGHWPEARVEVGARKTKRNGEIEYLKCYGISTSLSAEECLAVGQLLVSISPRGINFPETPDELRGIVMKLGIPDGVDPFEYLSGIIELPEKDRFPSILDGTADKNKMNVVKAAVVATEPVRSNPSVIYSNPIGYGAYIENRMKHGGYEMNPNKFGCGASNNEIVSSLSPYYQTGTKEPLFSSTESWHSGICRICHAPTLVGPCSICSICEKQF